MSYAAPARIQSYGDAPFVIICDHASNDIPDDLGLLGLDPVELSKHIAWDIGAAALSTQIARHLDGAAILCAHSRLLVDVNRAPEDDAAIPAVSDGIAIVGNQQMSPSMRTQRLERFHEPYHALLEKTVASSASRHNQLLVFSVHSYAPRLEATNEAMRSNSIEKSASDHDRPWHIGLLSNIDQQTARLMLDWLHKHTDYYIGDNEPYDGRIFSYTVDRHAGRRNLPHVTFEVRNDLLSTPAQIAEMGKILTRGIRHIAAQL